jgi:hypothetical protein
MKKNKEKIRYYLTELSIVTIGVLIALFLSNIKEFNQARKYKKATIETINNEITTNYSSLKDMFEQQKNLLDTIDVHMNDSCTIVDLFKKVNGLSFPVILNSGFEFYKNNQISSIDFEMMTTLIRMNYQSESIDKKLDELVKFIYPNAFEKTNKSKIQLTLYLNEAMGAERQLLILYENYLNINIETENDSE